jgi:hypothetical protein
MITIARPTYSSPTELVNTPESTEFVNEPSQKTATPAASVGGVVTVPKK